MKVEHTENSPILLKIIPETQLEVFKNGAMSESLSRMEIPHRFKKDGTLLVNVDPAGWKDFDEHE